MWPYLLELLRGLPVSLSLTITSLLAALLLSLLCTALLTLRTPLISPLIKGYITLFTGTPLLVQIFLIYYGPGQFEFIRQLPWIWDLFSSPWFCAILALTLNSTAYTTLLFHGAMRTIPTGQWESCAALGLSPYQSLHIMLPYAVKRALSSYSNEVVLIFKSTSLAYTITLMDVMGYTNYLYGNDYNLMAFIAAGLVYLTINALLTLSMRLIEKRALLFEQR